MAERINILVTGKDVKYAGSMPFSTTSTSGEKIAVTNLGNGNFQLSVGDTSETNTVSDGRGLQVNGIRAIVSVNSF